MIRIPGLFLASLFLTSALAAVEVGQKAPDFSLKDTTGKTYSLADYQDKVVVLEWTNQQCPFVQRHYREGTMQKLASQYADKGVVWLAINTTSSTTAEKEQQWRDKNKLTYPILLDLTGQTAKAYAAKTTPHLFIINKGVLVYQGGIDDDPQGEKAHRATYVSQAIDELLAGKPVSQPETKPYGCSVKYAK